MAAGGEGEMIHIGQLTPDPANARKHNPRNVGLIERALGEVGAARSIVIDENGVVLAGNATVEAAAAAGIERMQVVDADGETIIAVRRRNLTPDQKKRLALFDNRTSELADWDIEQLLADRDAGIDLASVGFSDFELAELLNEPMSPFDPSAEWQGMPEFEQDDQTPVKQLTINFAHADDLATFARLVEQTITMETRSVWFPAKGRERLRDLAYVGIEEAS